MPGLHVLLVGQHIEQDRPGGGERQLTGGSQRFETDGRVPVAQVGKHLLSPAFVAGAAHGKEGADFPIGVFFSVTGFNERGHLRPRRPAQRFQGAPTYQGGFVRMDDRQQAIFDFMESLLRYFLDLTQVDEHAEGSGGCRADVGVAVFGQDFEECRHQPGILTFPQQTQGLDAHLGFGVFQQGARQVVEVKQRIFFGQLLQVREQGELAGGRNLRPGLEQKFQLPRLNVREQIQVMRREGLGVIQEGIYNNLKSNLLGHLGAFYSITA